MWNLLCFGVSNVDLGLIVSFLLVLPLNQKVAGIPVFHMIFYLPFRIQARDGEAAYTCHQAQNSS